MLSSRCWTCESPGTHYCVFVTSATDPATGESLEITVPILHRLCLPCSTRVVHNTKVSDLSTVERRIQVKYPHLPPRDWSVAVIKAAPAEEIDAMLRTHGDAIQSRDAWKSN